MLKQSLDDEIKVGNKDMTSAKDGIAQNKETKSRAEGDLQTTSKELKGNIEQKADLHRDCMSRAEEFETTTTSRGEELKALATAKKIIKEATGGALNQMSFLQRSEISSSADIARYAAVRLVRALARKTDAPILAQLATRMAAALRSSTSADIFGKVKSLITDMIAKLEKEGDADATEKAYCDKEMSESAEQKTQKEAKVEKLTVSIDQMTSKTALLKSQVAELEKALADMASSQQEMDKLRREENNEFVEEKSELEKGIAGVQKALKVLKDYYASNKGHSAADGAGSGIIGLLEVCESDFSKGLADMVAAENAAQTSYERASNENKLEKATKDKDIEYKTRESAQLDKSVAEASSDREGAQDELDSILEYRKTLKDRCIAKAESFEEKAGRRAAEIDGLKQALEILDSQVALTQQGTARDVRHHHAA
jgi:hypothetical protein